MSNEYPYIMNITTAQRMSIPSPSTGCIVFDTDKCEYWYFNGEEWNQAPPPAILPKVYRDNGGKYRTLFFLWMYILTLFFSLIDLIPVNGIGLTLPLVAEVLFSLIEKVNKDENAKQ